MKKKNAKIIYDKESEVLSVELEKVKSVDSDIKGNVVLDYDKKGNIVRINLYGFNFDTFKENEKTFDRFAENSKSTLLVK